MINKEVNIQAVQQILSTKNIPELVSALSVRISIMVLAQFTLSALTNTSMRALYVAWLPSLDFHMLKASRLPRY